MISINQQSWLYDLLKNTRIVFDEDGFWNTLFDDETYLKLRQLYQAHDKEGLTYELRKLNL